MGANNTVIVGQAITSATVILGLLVQLYRERRNRQWRREDLATAADQHTILKAAIDDNKAAIDENTVKTNESTAAAREAYTEANNVNLKIEALGVHIAESVRAVEPEGKS